MSLSLALRITSVAMLISSLAFARTGNLTFESTMHDFGDQYRGEKLSHRFKFTNSGDGPLTIQGVHAACGCTAVEVEKGRKYLPGESGQVEIKLDTTEFAGAVVKTVTVMTSERLLPDRTLTIKANVKAEVEALPPLADFGDVVSKVGATQIVMLKPIGSFNLDVSDLSFNQEILEASVVKEGPAYKVTVRLKPGVKPGFLKEVLTVKTNSAHLKELPIPVRAEIKGAIDVAPSYVEFGAIAPQEHARRSLTMKSTGDVKITGTRAELNVNGKKLDNADSFIKVETLSYEKEKRLVAIELKNGASLAGSVHGKLYLATNDPDQKEIAVDFYAFFR